MPDSEEDRQCTGLDRGFRCFGGINRWNEDLRDDIRKEIEEHWSRNVREGRFEEGCEEKEKLYILSMFPYPSGSLHMGHVRVYSISDVLARFFRMKGKNVLHPMGWDAFGLPAENAALERGIDPDEWTQKNIANMKALMEEMNFSFDWNREFATCDSDYYKWTQFLFIKLYEKDLVYRKEAVVNWDPVDQTVLANEQVDDNGRSWRSGALVEKKMLMQWFVRTTTFAESLYDGLSDPTLRDWRDIIEVQRHWIGKPNGTTINFQVVEEGAKIENREISIWMNRPEYVDRAKFVAIKSDSTWTFGFRENGPLPYRLKNPFTNELLPVYIVDSMEYPPGTEVRLGIPDLSESDKAFADFHRIPYSPGLQKVATKEELKELRKKICADAIREGIGGYPMSSNIKDWLISRQRYWGTPIPIIYCKTCGTQPVPENDLPVKLPKLKSITLGKNPLREIKSWLNVECPKCGGEATRETDTMDTFVDSSWYYLRYLDPDNEKAAFDVEKVSKIMPVDIYIGGKEHATLHLYFARFINHFLHSVHLVPEREPFRRLLCQGMVKGKTYRLENTGQYVPFDKVQEKEGKHVHRDTGDALKVDYEKMSKSKYNGIEPGDLLKRHGVDTTRLMVLGEASPHSDLLWNEKSFKGIFMWQNRLWRIVANFIQIRSKNMDKPKETTEDFEKLDYFMFDSRNFHLEKVTTLLEVSFNVATAIAKMQGLTAALRKADENIVAFSPQYERALALQIIMLYPIVPSFASELWAGFLKAPNRLSSSEKIPWDLPLGRQNWPTVDADYQMRSEKVVGMLKLTKQKTREEIKQEKRMKKRAAAAAAAAAATSGGEAIHDSHSHHNSGIKDGRDG